MRSKEFAQPKHNLVIFDIDDTLLHTTAKIRVVKDGRPVRELTNQEFNNYQLQPGEEFDFGEFRDAEKFNRESQPIKPMINKLKTILNHSSNSEVIMLTARADFDNRDLFLKTFTDLGIDMSRVHVHRAGNLPGDDIPAEKKAVIVRKYAETGKYDHIRLYDDSRSNLSVFKELQAEYPDIDFRAYYVGPTGGTAIHESFTREEITHFVEMFKKFLPLAMHYLELDSLPTMKFQQSINDQDQPTFGRFENDNNTLYVALANRHPNDILRTIAHELQHYKQGTQHRLEPDSGETGSPIENEAHAMAGIVMRHFNKKYPQYLNSKPMISEGAVTDLEKDLKNPTGYDAIDHMMKSIAKKYNITPKELHNKFVEKHKKIPDDWIKENFADGKGPGRPGDSQRHGIPKHATMAELEKASHAKGRKGQLARWQLNMRRGHKK